MSSPGRRSTRSTPSKRSDTSDLQPLPPSSPGPELLPATSPAPTPARLHPGKYLCVSIYICLLIYLFVLFHTSFACLFSALLSGFVFLSALSEVDLSSPLNYGTPSSVGSSVRTPRSGVRGTPIRHRSDIRSDRRMRQVCGNRQVDGQGGHEFLGFKLSGRSRSKAKMASWQHSIKRANSCCIAHKWKFQMKVRSDDGSGVKMVTGSDVHTCVNHPVFSSLYYCVPLWQPAQLTFLEFTQLFIVTFCCLVN